MKLNVLALALVASALGTVGAAAQTTIIEDRRPGVVIERQPPVVIERREPVVVEQAPPVSTTTTTQRGGFLGTESKTTTETVGTGPHGDCATRTVHRQDLTGEKTVSRTDCP